VAITVSLLKYAASGYLQEFSPLLLLG
jgi:hypothetical protein